MARRLPFLLLLVSGWLTATPVAASTLSPAHPVWERADLDLRSLRDAVTDVDPALRRWDWARTAKRASKGYGAYGPRVLVVPVLYADSGGPPVGVGALGGTFFAEGTEASVRGFWTEVSSGRFRPQGLVTDWVRLPGDRNFYANVRDGVFRGNAGPRLLVRDAIRGLGERLDLTAFDDDGPDGIPGSGDDDGRIDLLVVLHPDVGFEVDPVATGPAVLAHQGRIDLDPERPQADVAAAGYALVSATGPLGVVVHEMGHLLGLTDLYDLDVTGDRESQPQRGGLGIWSLMSDGTWGGDGAAPSNLDAHSRRLLGWEDDPIEVLVPGQWILDPVVAGNNQSLRVQPQGDWRGEHFLLENRRRRDGVVDGDLPGSGILALQVDPTRIGNDGSEGYQVSVLEADGGGDLPALRDNGTASDLFQGPDVLAGDTTPSTMGGDPDPSRLPPRLEIAVPDAQDGHLITVQMTDAPNLRLLEAFFPAGSNDRRTWLSPGEEEQWFLRFRSLSATDPTTADLFLDGGLDPRLELTADDPIRLVRDGAWWVPSSPVRLRSTMIQAEPVPPVVAFSLIVDGTTQQPVELGVPIGFQPGLAGGDFFRWEPTVVAAGPDTTRFALLGIEGLPLSADSGWVTTVDGAPGYTDRADLVLESPWFSIPVKGELQWWSRHETEASQPGQAWDGGVLEILAPGRGWQPLVPEGPDLVWIEPASAASTRGRLGFGGPATEWQSYRTVLPSWDAPVRVRVRFGSDATFHPGAWSIAGLGTRPDGASAEITTYRDPVGRLIGRADFRGDLARLASGRFMARAPLETAWTPVTGFLDIREDLDFLEARLDLPDAPILTLGFFAEEELPSAPALLLGVGGYRAPQDPTRLASRSSPGPGPLQLAVTPLAVRRHVDLFDLRGRRVRTLEIGPQIAQVEWDGTDGTGSRVASGRYIAVLREDPGARTSLVLVR